MRQVLGLGAVALLAISMPGPAAAVETILVNGKIATADAPGTMAEALAIDGGRIVGVGDNASIRKLVTGNTRVIDLSGRRVIPGLIDSHTHAIRAGLTWQIEQSWVGVKSLGEGLEMLRRAAGTAPKGAWIRVVGGWHKSQLKENRLPTPAELDAISRDRPIYVQHLWSKAVLNSAALAALKLTDDKQLRPRGKLERDASGKPTGVIRGNVPVFSRLLRKLPAPTAEQKRSGTLALFRDFNRQGITGFIDAAGGGMFWKKSYQTVLGIAKAGKLSLRVRFRLMPQPPHRDKEMAIYRKWGQDVAGGFGDGMLKWAGWGEVIAWGMHDGGVIGRKFTPKGNAGQRLREALLWIARRKENLEIHATTDLNAGRILDIMEAVNKQADITGLRWTIAHIDDATEATLRRMKALGIGYSVQDRLYFVGNGVERRLGREKTAEMPPVNTALAMGLVIGGGSDGPRTVPFSPMRALQWVLDGKTVSGRATRGPGQIPTRQQALRMFTWNNAWLSGEEKTRGSLEIGKLADLAVLDRDILTIPVANINAAQSLLTMVGGKVVFAQGVYRSLEL
jgi:predicted amidohydrolase YtcJ